MSAPSPEVTVDAFLDALSKSGLLTAEAMAAAQAAAAKHADPKAAARELIKSGTLTRWQATQLLHGFHQLVIGKFKLLEQLGAGEMGRVYLAEHAQIGRRHTLKVLARRHMANPELVKRFLADAASACSLDHRNISHVFDVTQEGDRCYVVMEYVEGENLDKLIQRRGKLPVREALEYVRQATEGLAHAHDSGIIHGDLKPSNLLLEGGGTLKILDFGQSRLFTAPAGGADESREVPTLAARMFQSPEVRGTADRAPDARSDVYSLGSVLCFLLSGKPALDAGEAAKELQAAGAQAEVVEWCQRLMAEDPAQRPASMAGLLSELGGLARALTALPPKPKAESRPEPTAESRPVENRPVERPAPKVKKPPVARPLEEPALPVAKTIDEAPASGDAEESEPQAAAPFAGIAVQSPGRGKKPPVKAAPQVAVAIAPAAEKPAALRPAKSSKAPQLIIAAVCGVLLLGGGGFLIAKFALGGNDKPVAAAPAKSPPVTAVKKSDDAKAAEANPVETNPAESNPAETNPVEANPTVAAPVQTPPLPATTAATEKTKNEPPAAKTTEPTTPEPTPEPKPAPPAKAAAPPAKTEPKAKAKPDEEPKPKPEANPFAGFAKSITLPPLAEGMTGEALAPATLGPCQVEGEAIVHASLKGGETAIRGSKLKFDLQPKNGTAPRDWEFHLIGGEAPTVIATLAAKEGNLVFQWTEAAAKQVLHTKQLCNGAIELACGANKHLVALREPAMGAPLAIEFEKPQSAKWTIENLPDPKSIQIEITKVDGLPKLKQEPIGSAAIGEDLQIWTGPDADSLFLCLRIDTSPQARGLQVASTPQLRLPAMAKPAKYSKKEVTAARQTTNDQLASLTNQLTLLSKQKKTQQTDAMKGKIQSTIDEMNKGAAVIQKLFDFVASMQGIGTIQFRVFHQADDAQIDLLITGGDAK